MLYTKEQLAYERSIGLVLSDYDNEYPNGKTGNIQQWSNEQFESYLASKTWDESIKKEHRISFNGLVELKNGTITYH